MNIKKAIIPTAGFATRFLPVTKALPKAMLPIVDKPVIHYLIEEAIASGIEEIIIITGQDREEIKNYFNRSKDLEEHLVRNGKQDLLEIIQKISERVVINYVTQKQPLGLGHAIYCARDFIAENEMFSVLLGDDIVYAAIKPCLAQLIEIFTEYQSNIIGVQHVPNNLVNYYGIVTGKAVSERVIKVEDLVEKPDIQSAPSNLAIMCRYILHSDIFGILETMSPGKDGEIQLTDALRILNRTQEFYAYNFEGTNYDIGDKLGFLKATTEFALKHEEIGEAYRKYLLHILNQDFT